MRRSIKMITVLGLTFGAVALTGGNASANTAEDYRDNMANFVPIISDWIDEVENLADRAVAKPSEACSDEVASLARRGAGMSQDLEGTVAPAALGYAHDELVGAMLAMAADTADGCTIGSGLANAVADDIAETKDALRKIGYFAQSAPINPIEMPIPPVTGN